MHWWMKFPRSDSEIGVLTICLRLDQSSYHHLYGWFKLMAYSIISAQLHFLSPPPKKLIFIDEIGFNW